MVWAYTIGESMMQIGDLVKYKKHIDGQRDQGVWLVIAIEVDENFGELVTLKKGEEQRFSHSSHLDKISSSR
tara:strand:+ start:185 stop:400 length:216 start_codon:yes stop_codon:yes gene_type:complete